MTEPTTRLYRLPWPPTVNTYWRAVRGRAILSKRGRDYQQTAGWTIQTQGRPPEPMQGPLTISLVFHRPDERRRDADNLAKAVLDNLTKAGVIAGDDRQTVRRLVLEWSPRKDDRGGYVLVTVTPYAGATPHAA